MPGEPCAGSNFVRVNSAFVGRRTAVGVGVGDADGVGGGVVVDFGVAVGVGVDIGEGLGVGVTVSVGAGDAVGNSAAGEISFCGDDVGLGGAEFSAFDGVGVGDCPPADGECFNFGFGVGVGLGTGVCAGRSTPRCAPRVAAPPGRGVLAGVYTLKEKNDRFGVGVGVGVALSVNARASSNTDVGKGNLQLMQLRCEFLAKRRPFEQR